MQRHTGSSTSFGDMLYPEQPVGNRVFFDFMPREKARKAAA